MKTVEQIRAVFISSLKKSHRSLQQRINIKFCVKIKKDTSEACAVISEVCDTEAMNKLSVFGWRIRFEGSGTDVKIKCRSYDKAQIQYSQARTNKESSVVILFTLLQYFLSYHKIRGHID